MTAILYPQDEKTGDEHLARSDAADDRVMLFVPVDGPPLDVAGDGETRVNFRDPKTQSRTTRDRP